MVILFKFGQYRYPAEIGDVGFFTFYPYFWGKNNEGQLEIFFRSAPEWLQSQVETARVVYLAWQTDSLAQLWRAPSATPSNHFNPPLVILQNYLTFKDFSYLFKQSCAYAIKLIRYLSFYRKKINYQWNGLAIQALLRDELEFSLFNMEVMKSLFIYRALTAFFKKTSLKLLIYRAEFQPHERSVIMAARNRCVTLGFQHQVIARNHLQYFFAENEVTQAYQQRDAAHSLPLPDALLVTGQYSANVFLQNQFDLFRIKQVGPLRYVNLINYLANRASKESLRQRYGIANTARVLVVAAPITHDDVVNLFYVLDSACQQIKQELVIFIKSHPVTKFDALIQSIISIHHPHKIQILDDNIEPYDYLALSDATLMIGTTLGVEALCLGSMPIVYEFQGNFCLNPLLEIERSCMVVRTVKELVLALTNLFEPAILNHYQRYWQDDIRYVFSNIEDNPLHVFAQQIKNLCVSAAC